MRGWHATSYEVQGWCKHLGRWQPPPFPCPGALPLHPHTHTHATHTLTRTLLTPRATYTCNSSKLIAASTRIHTHACGSTVSAQIRPGRVAQAGGGLLSRVMHHLHFLLRLNQHARTCGSHSVTVHSGDGCGRHSITPQGWVIVYCTYNTRYSTIIVC